MDINYLKEKARSVRLETFEMVTEAKSCHIGSSFSCIDLLVTLYFEILNLKPENPKWEYRDRFILSKGHACSGLYVTLSERGFFPQKELKNYLKNGTYFTAHTNSEIPGVELSTGSLGHGLGVGIGLSLAAKKDSKNYKTYVLVSDGELDEGSSWEAIMLAAHLKLDNLITILDYNKIQSFGRVEEVLQLEPLTKKFECFGWNVKEVDGHDFQQIYNALKDFDNKENKPNVLIAHTIKGKGVSFMENTVECHYLTPNKEQYDKGIEELKKA